jgi:hypothetical protein
VIVRLPNPGDRSDVPPFAFPVDPPNYVDSRAMKMCYLASDGLV